MGGEVAATLEDELVDSRHSVLDDLIHLWVIRVSHPGDSTLQLLQFQNRIHGVSPNSNSPEKRNRTNTN